MNKLIKLLCLFMLSQSWAMTDQVTQDRIAVIVNKHVITEREVDNYVEAYAKLSNNTSHQNDPGFRSYITSTLVTWYLLEDFASTHGLSLSSEDEKRALTYIMENEGRTYEEFGDYAQEIGVSEEFLKKIYYSGALQQKIGFTVIVPSLEVSDDEMVHAKHQYIDAQALYKIKSWTVGFDEVKDLEDVKEIKRNWAQTGQDPEVGEVMDLGWRSRSTVPELFLKAIEGVSPGNLVGPVQSMHGYHLVWFEGEKVPDMPSDDDIREGILQQKYQEKFVDWIHDLQNFNIVIYK